MRSASLSESSTTEGWRPLSGLVALNVGCVIEPAIGVAWQRALARASGADLAWYHSALLASGLWLVYAGDRWLDACSPQHPDTLRHAFFARHRSGWSLAIAMVAVLSIGVAVASFSSEDWGAASGALTAALGYVFLVHVARIGRWLKKAIAAVVYTVGVGAFLWSSAQHLVSLVAGQLLLVALAGCNLASISLVEVGATARGLGSVRMGCMLLFAATALSALSSSGGDAALLASIATSSLLLAVSSSWRRAPRELAHALADLALLLPFLVCL